MSNISPETITVIVFNVQFTDAEARDVLVDPAPFQKQLRQALAEGRGRKNSITLGKNGSARPKASAAPPKGFLACPRCANKFTSQGYLDRHLERKHGRPAPAAV